MVIFQAMNYEKPYHCLAFAQIFKRYEHVIPSFIKNNFDNMQKLLSLSQHF
jgi:hypothetical protein